MDKQQILQNLQGLQAGVARFARDPAHPPMILPVTKTQPVEAIQVLREAGFQQIGENRVQEITAKYTDLGDDFAFHLIGRLQTNKIKYIIGKVCMVQSLDRMELAQALDTRCQAAGVRMPVLIEVNIGGEAQKAGIPVADVIPFAREAARMPGLHLRGLMTVLPIADSPETLRPLFAHMRTVFECLQSEAIDQTDIDTLSMGMSGDWQVAAQEGATVLRIGSAIFGKRPPVGANR